MSHHQAPLETHPTVKVGERGLPTDPGEEGLARHTLIPLAIVLAAVLFNPLLAIVNANVRPLTSATVIACEVAIVLAAHAYALLRFDRRMSIWYAYIAALAAFALVRSLATGDVEIKYLRDLMVIPTFVVLGIAAAERRAVECMVLLQLAVVGGILLEASSVEAYSALFQVKDYYINTRGMAAGEFTAEDSTLFVSAMRPEARYFPFFDLHRLSSIFLEPVSLGNFAIISVCFTLAFWSRLAPWQRWLMPLSIMLVLVACDGRLSALASVAIVGAALVAPLLPRSVALLFLPLITLMTLASSLLGDFRVGSDDFPGRLAHTQHWLGQMWLSDVLGASDRLKEGTEDSGILYLIVSQSLPGVVLLWMLIVLSLPERSVVQQLYKNGICLYLSFTMMISYGFLSIKTAAPLWFVYGILIAMATSTYSRECRLAADRTEPGATASEGARL
jgi:putative polymerase